MDGLPRTVSLVIVASPASGQPSRVLGITEPTPVSTPWWPDTRPITEAFGAVVVIRLLTTDRLEAIGT